MEPTMADVIDCKILGTGGAQYALVELDPGETAIAEAGAMVYMTSGVTFEAKMGDGSSQGVMGSLLGAAKRAMAGESIFLTHFTNSGHGKQHVALAAPHPGEIVAMDLSKLGGQVVCQRSAFLAAAHGTRIEIEFTRRFGAGLFGGEGFVLTRLEGNGLAFVHAGGSLIEHELRGETLRIDTGCVVAFEKSSDYDIQSAGGLKSMFFGGEGMFLATLSGTGSVWLQTMPFSRLANSIASQIPSMGDSK